MDRLHDVRLLQRQPQQFVDRGVVQAFALGDLTAGFDHTVVEQLLPVERPRQRRQRGLVVHGGRLGLHLRHRRQAAKRLALVLAFTIRRDDDAMLAFVPFADQHRAGHQVLLAAVTGGRFQPVLDLGMRGTGLDQMVADAPPPRANLPDELAFGEASQHLLARAAVDVGREPFDAPIGVVEGVGEDGVLGRGQWGCGHRALLQGG